MSPSEHRSTAPLRVAATAAAVLAVLSCGATTVRARSNIPPPTGTAGDPGASTCNQAFCHTGTTLNSRDVTLDLIDVATSSRLTQYQPGTTYALRFTIASPEAGRLRWGFEMTSLAGTTMAGSFTAGPTTATQTGAGRQYVSHAANQVGDNVPMGFNWTFSWLAPATDVGEVVFYACGNAANRSFSAAGDYIECTTFRVTPQVAPPDGDGDTVPDVTDNCPNTPNGGQADFDGDNIGDACDDSDFDGTLDAAEIAQGTSALDADSDDDGLSDTEEVDSLGTLPNDADTDGDGIQDGTELGETVGVPDPPGPATGTNFAVFVPDADDLSSTDPELEDTDGDTCLDGAEDVNANGAVDLPGDTDPEDPLDCPVVVIESLMRLWRSNRDPPPLAHVACANTPCTGTLPPDIVICREAVNFEEYPGATLPFEVPLVGPGGFPGVLVFIEYDSNTSGAHSLDLIDVIKDPTRPGGILVIAH